MRNNSDLLNNIHARRLSFCKQNKEKDCVVLEGKNNILISSPHGVSQVRLGRYKVAEIGSLAVALFLKDNTNCWLIAKTKNNNDDANFDTVCNYKNEVKKLILRNNIKYVLDIHGLAEKRECDVNLGIHLGQHIQTDVKLFEKLKNSLTKKGFVVWVDQPFMAGGTTISNFAKNLGKDIWSIQIEINCGITNKENKKLSVLLDTLKNWIKEI